MASDCDGRSRPVLGTVNGAGVQGSRGCSSQRSRAIFGGAPAAHESSILFRHGQTTLRCFRERLIDTCFGHSMHLFC